MLNKKFVSLGILAAVAAFAVSAPAFADDHDDNRGGLNLGLKMGVKSDIKSDIKHDLKDDVRMMMKPAVVGKVSAINGSTLTVTSRGMSQNEAITTFTVDASGALVMRGNATSTVGAIVLGDNVFVQGTVSGTNVVATKIFDFALTMPKRDGKDKEGTSTPPFKGNGQPVVMGTVSAVNGSSLTITNSGNATYTVDATNAKIVVKGNSSATLSNIAVGDNVLVQGAISGTSISASSVIDGSAKNGNGNNGGPKPEGFFGRIGGFFKHLFGF